MKNANNGDWKGSTLTMAMVANQIAERWGDKAVEDYDPEENCFTYNKWKRLGYQVKKGEKGLRSITYIKLMKVDKKTKKEEEVLRPRTVVLFYKLQVEKKV